MFTTNPFSELSGTISPETMQIYVILMVIMVVGGTIIDMIHKKSAQYFFENSKKAEKNAKRTVSSGEKMSLAVQTVASEVLTSSEFCNPQRRLSHLLTMYGFIIFVVSTATLIFAYPTEASAGIWPMLWHIGAAMLCVGGYWFWFIIRVDVSAEGKPWYKLAKADIFIVSLLTTATFGLLWSATQGGGLGWLFFALFIISSTSLFGTVLWSKFAHMFFKPAAAYQKKMTKIDGSQENLPDLGELSDPALQSRYPDIPEYMGTNPPNMGLGIKREAPQHY
ncbi:MAG: adenylyl-sulfate reductase [Candidatus Thiodiazotropha lotti]|uniref:Adenylyl-sulfate reductase n=1 Tax=Candidatus Thiodiazotropha lotti TaxID=2792787 RepID=A0A9E4MY11_9GAMM|nr:adenylyl-sulfate reductase [Candidatus Thiodiazotropha lotti]MCG7921071.1 adenylyl-sulfate reductase [Candidatus Thiodiazotropha lotti]MCG7929087.1 adenylyl-sulfate reductase [Candidatus Thiodiazotropha lotti]MCG7937366.1 adenylyl-sulfate reductase [Candidatus Thiodiazotropha lotti]MCG7986339.1 adenylyl-sulfate reductase [Candidatus Thiodiazotropha lotti]